jgi:hypothetical protein
VALVAATSGTPNDAEVEGLAEFVDRLARTLVSFAGLGLSAMRPFSLFDDAAVRFRTIVLTTPD